MSRDSNNHGVAVPKFLTCEQPCSHSYSPPNKVETLVVVWKSSILGVETRRGEKAKVCKLAVCAWSCERSLDWVWWDATSRLFLSRSCRDP